MRPSRRAALAGLLVLAALGGVRLLRPALALACIAAGACLALALRRGEDWTAWVIALAVVLSATAASLVTYRGSLVAREGPAR